MDRGLSNKCGISSGELSSKDWMNQLGTSPAKWWVKKNAGVERQSSGTSWDLGCIINHQQYKVDLSENCMFNGCDNEYIWILFSPLSSDHAFRYTLWTKHDKAIYLETQTSRGKLRSGGRDECCCTRRPGVGWDAPSSCGAVARFRIKFGEVDWIPIDLLLNSQEPRNSRSTVKPCGYIC